jgi:3-deoxy-D-manno-octulosonic-acid transferase
MRFVYTLLAYLLAPIVIGVMLWRGLRDRSYWQNLGERFGFGLPPERGDCIWVHAVSVGEVQASAALVRSLRERFPELPIVLTTVTPTGAERARAQFGDLVHVRFVPYDLPGSVRRFFDRVQPRLAIILETELWPNLYNECGRRGVPLVLASARISPRSVDRYRRLASLFRETLSHGIVIAAQSEGDAERFRSIGANPTRTHVTGNIKFDVSLPTDIASVGAGLRAAHAGARLVWVAGSTHAGEEEIVLDVQRALGRGGRRPLLVLVPRHPARFSDVATLLQRRGVRFVRRSSGAHCTDETDVLLVDTLGELVNFYAACDVAFVGGSLVPIGGHNLLEPAVLGVPILTGPHSFNAADIAELLIAAGAAEVVTDAAALQAALERLLGDSSLRARRGAIGRSTVDRNRGALDRLLALIEPVLRRGV